MTRSNNSSAAGASDSNSSAHGTAYLYLDSPNKMAAERERKKNKENLTKLNYD